MTAICSMLLVMLTVMISLAYVERRDASIGQAKDFAESVNQMTNAMLTGMMIPGVSKDRSVCLEQVRNSNNINALQVFRSGSTITQYGAGVAAEAKASAEEK